MVLGRNKMTLQLLGLVAIVTSSSSHIWSTSAFVPTTIPSTSHRISNGNSVALSPLNSRSSSTSRNRNIPTTLWSPSIASSRDKIRTSSTSSRLYSCFSIAGMAQCIPTEVWACILPPMLGFWKNEYTVSYGYGTATFLTGLIVLRRLFDLGVSTTSSLPTLLAVSHAAALTFFGLRLNIFLFIRSQWSRRIQEMEERIEQRAKDTYKNRFSRINFILSCGFLFYGLCAPVLLSSSLFTSSKTFSSNYLKDWMVKFVFPTLISIQWFGYIVAAIGDCTKTIMKKVIKKNENHLVTNGIFSFVRHPNYSGEMISWTANALCGSLACAISVASLLSSSSSATTLTNKFKLILPTLVKATTAITGTAGLLFVLLRATANLEDKQATDYGDLPEYKEWIKSTWSGWKLEKSSSSTSSDDTENEITMNDVNEEYGSGI